MGWVVGKKRKKRDFDLIPPRKKPKDLDFSLPPVDDIEPLVKLEGGRHRSPDPSPDEIWGPGGLAQEAREYFAGKKAENRGGSSGKKISKTEKDRGIVEKLLDPLGYFSHIKIDDLDDLDDD